MAEGMQLGKYTLKRRLATGGMAEIWLAEQRGPGGFAKELVVKRILPHLANDEKFVQMFLDEARLAAQLTHPNIVQIYDLGEADGDYFIAMEYIRGHDLEQVLHASILAGAPLDPLAAARIISDACAGLDFAHNFTDSRGRAMNLVHRDVSPQNILVSDQGAVKLVDFGVAKAATSTHKTQTGAVKGKFAYMSPEQISGKTLDGRSDLFAMGIVLFELLAGQRPFGHDSELMAVTAILHHPTPDLRELRPEVPLELRDIVEKALAKDPNQRWQSAEDMQASLEGVLAASGQPVGRKTLATYIDGLFSDTPQHRPLTTPLAPTSVGRATEQGVPPSLRHGPQEQPTAKRTSDPGVHQRRTERVPAGLDPHRDTQPLQHKRGVGPGMWVAIVLVFIALAGAGYYLYDTLSKKSGGGGEGTSAQVDAGAAGDSGTLATGGADAGVRAPDAGASAPDTGGAVATADAGTAGTDAGTLAAELDAGGLAATLDGGGLDASLLPDGAVAVGDTGPAGDAGLVMLGDTGPVPASDVGSAAAGDTGQVALGDAGPVAAGDAGALAAADAAAPDAGAASTDLGGVAALDGGTAAADAGIAAVPDAGPAADAGMASADVAGAGDTAAVATTDAGGPADTGPIATADAGGPGDAGGSDVQVALADTGVVPTEEDAGEADAGTVATQQEEEEEEHHRGPGYLRVVVSTHGRFEVLVDGHVVGRNPLPRQELSAGRHRVEVRRVGATEGTTERVTIRSGRTETITIAVE